jgi:hypothetical protein
MHLHLRRWGRALRDRRDGNGAESDLRRAAREQRLAAPSSDPRSSTRRRSSRSSFASERRARKISVSTADGDSSSSAAISAYASPCHSRMTIVRCCRSGRCASAS